MSQENQAASSARKETAPEQLLLDLDPASIVLGDGPNREESTLDPEFWALVASVRAAGGNVQPIKVRLQEESVPLLYELVYGHRRVLACKYLNLKVKAIIEPSLTRVQALVQRVSENMARVPFRPIELGRLAIYGVESGMYGSLRAFAAAVDIDMSLVSKGATLAKLPESVLAAFPSVLELQYKHAKVLGDAMQRDREGLEARAQEICKSNEKPATPAAIKILIGSASRTGVEPFNTAHALVLDGAEVGWIRPAKDGFAVSLTKEVVPADLERFLSSLRKWLHAKLASRKASRKPRRPRTGLDQGTVT